MQLKNHRGVATLFQNAHFRFHAYAFRESLVAKAFVADHAATDLFAYEQQNSQANACGGRGDKAEAQCNTDHCGDNREIENSRARLQEMQAGAIDHAYTDHGQNRRQCRDRHPRDQAAKNEERHQRENAFDQARELCLCAT